MQVTYLIALSILVMSIHQDNNNKKTLCHKSNQFCNYNICMLVHLHTVAFTVLFIFYQVLYLTDLQLCSCKFC